MEGLDAVRCLVKYTDWLVKLDLQHAYFTVPIASDHHKYLRFFWMKISYEYKCLPFDLSSTLLSFHKSP